MMTDTKPVRRVLVAEDNEDHLYLTVRALKDWENDVELEVDAVSDGEQLLDFLYRRHQAGRGRRHASRAGGGRALLDGRRDPAGAARMTEARP